MKEAKSYSEACTQTVHVEEKVRKKGLKILQCFRGHPAAFGLWLYYVQNRRNSKETVLENNTWKNPLALTRNT